MTGKPTLWRKLLRGYIIAGLLLLLFIGAISHRELRNEKLRSIEAGLSGQLAQLDLAVEMYFSSIESGVRALADNPLVSTRDDADFTNFTQANERNFTYRTGPVEQRIIALFHQYRSYYSNVHSVYMGRENGGFIRSHKRERPTRYDPRERDWYILAKDNPGRVMRTKPYRSVTSSDINIGTVTALVDENGVVFGVVGMDVTLEELGRFVADMHVGHDGRVALVADNGDVLASGSPLLRGRNIRDVFPEEADAILGRKAGTRITRDRRFALCHQTSERLAWNVLVITPMAAINKEILPFSLRILLIVILSLVVLGALVGIGLQRMVIDRIERLGRKAEEISASGRLATILDPGPDDEIGALGRSFNRMLGKLGAMDERLRAHSSELEATVRQRTAELARANQQLENELALRTRAEQNLMIQKAYLEQLFATSPEAMVLISNEDRVLRVNSEFTRVFGFQPEEVVGRSLDDTIIPPELWNEGAAVKKRILGGNRDTFEARRRRKDGSLVDVSIIGTTMEIDGRHHGVYAIYRDITRNKQQEEELRRAKEAAESADRIKSAFLASMSHELRTPLNSIIGFTGILLQQLAGPLNDEQAKQMGMVQKSARHLLELINDVLDISKIEAGQLELSVGWFSFRDSVEKSLNLIGPGAGDKGLNLHMHIDPSIGEIRGDRRRFEQVLLNLLGNALKFTEQGTITVDARLEGRRVITRVTDTGIGIKAEDMAALFKAFSQIETGLSRRYEGTGLGLSICRKLVEMMGGSVRAESGGPGLGATFMFDLPVDCEEAS